MRGADTLRCGKINPNLTVIHCMNHHDAVKHATEATTHFLLHIFRSTYWLSGLVIYSFFFSSIMDQGLSPDIWRGGVTCQWWKPLPKENKRSSDVHPQHILICRLTVAQIFIFYLFGWQHAVSLHFQMISCKLLKFACLTIWCYVRTRDLFLAGYVCIVWSDCLFCVFKKETWH